MNLYEKAKRLIPGGTQLLSKRPEMFCSSWPAYYDHANGCEVWADGKCYIDFSTMGIGACILGYADPDVNAAVIECVRKGSMTSLNAPEEVALAESICALHPWADMARFCRSGGEAMAVAVRIARAKTGRDVVLFSGYHGWQDWYISANLADDSALDGHLLPGLEPRGVPRALQGTAIPFQFNDVEMLESLLCEHDGKVAAVVVESVREVPPSAEFIAALHQASDDGVVLVLDEITSCFRVTHGGAHLAYGLSPDIAVFGKALGNGYPISAVIGRERVMEAAQSSFISSTFWTERIGPVAALATIKKMGELNVSERLHDIGLEVQRGWLKAATKAGLDIRVKGIPALSHFEFNSEPLLNKTIFTEQMLERGFLSSTAFYPSFAHREFHVSHYLSAVSEVFKDMARGKAKLQGEVCHAGFRRLTDGVRTT